MTVINSEVGSSGSLKTKVIRRYQKAPLGWKIRNSIRPSFWLGAIANFCAYVFTQVTGIPTMTAVLRAKKILPGGQIVDYGIICHRVVTTAFVNYLTDEFQLASAVDAFTFHGSGTGTNAEAVGDTALQTAVESRDDGSQTEGASANIYRTVGTVAYTATRAITEHGLFSASTGGTLMDRSVFSAINVDNGDSIQFTYDLTTNSGG